MSTQLTLYPQNYQGFVNTPVISLNICNDNVWFASFIGVTSLSVVNPETAINTNAPTTNWQGHYTGALTPPTFVFNIFLAEAYIHFYGGAGNFNNSGIYQKLTGLVPGQQYEVLVDVKQAQPHNANLNAFYFGVAQPGNITTTPVCGGPNQPVQLIDTTSTGLTTPVTFTAQNAEETLSFIYASNATANTANALWINEVIVRKATTFQIDDGQVIVDLYNEQNIPLTLSIDNFKNAGEKQQSYSKAFKLPGTKHNNLIFENVFELTRDSLSTPVWSPYIQTRAVYKEDGNIIFQGFLKLIDVQEKNGELSYNVNLFSEAVAFASLAKAENLSALDFDELQHSYNREVIANSWEGTLNLHNPLPANSFAGTAGATTTNVLKYPNCNWNGQIYRTPTTWHLQNNADPHMPAIDNLQTMFRPWIRLRYIVDKIFARHGFTFQSAFFDSAYFKRLFMDFNWGKEINWSEQTQVGYVEDDGSSALPSFAVGYHTLVLADNNTWQTAGYDIATGKFTAPASNMVYILNANCTFTNTSTNLTTFRMFWKHTENATSNTNVIDMQFIQVSPGQTFTLQAILDSSLPGINIAIYDTIELRVRNVNGNNVVNLNAGSNISGSVTGSSIIGGTLLNTQRGKLKQWDVLKGIMSMFNLLMLQDPDDPQNLLIEPYNDIFINNNRIKEIDWTEKVDAQEWKFKPMDLKRTTMFQYIEDKDYPFQVYKSALNGFKYGSLEYTVPSYTQVQGEGKVEAKPFAATVVKPYFSDIPTWIGPNIYAANADATEFEGINNKPRILYDVTGDTVGATSIDGGTTNYFIPYQNGTTGGKPDNFSCFSHTSTIPSTNLAIDLNFGACQLIGIGTPPVNNLYSQYYQDYFYELYHPNTRTLTLKILLNAGDIANFKFYDHIIIKNMKFRVSTINYKPYQLSDVELILIP